ncbi:O-methyltransferase family 3 [Beutenbergia cavernae DSM 12333]|uniref:O-methyltransferase family 3 n=1 Tax=Beutenbergia cavernae (strain ATCC BAA-8 / DSM 12333 / CCUG 43141 / JCM 11478 / NBRC 16432 / NCIMB 13614 / HKI 0122) TaxID=471853 RepID=C5BZ52_BEUC1|nr:O-methyltransferase [Beutenbergia cavernae]ACQ81167.1 O-methyltransferase family 3 [Beutenbergia cavernae DSM 12333]
MSGDKAQSWTYAESYAEESEAIAGARARAEEYGVRPVSPGTGAVLRMLAAALGARVVAEVGTGTGVSGLWLLEGMTPDGVLTTVDVEVEHQRAAREAFAAAAIAPTRTRAIGGRALDVLPRLADGAYDLVLVDGDPAEAADCAEQAVRLLRPRGALVVTDALWYDRVADPARRDEDTVAMRELGKSLRADERLQSALLPAGDGLLVATRR